MFDDILIVTLGLASVLMHYRKVEVDDALSFHFDGVQVFLNFV